jgi:hypothetical protein
VTRRRAFVFALLVLALSAGTGVAVAAFSAIATNPGNTFTAAATFDGMRLATGQYTGNGAARSIAVPFQPDVVIIKGDTTQNAVIRTSSMPAADNTKPLAGATGFATLQIQSLTATGFNIGTSAAVNGNTLRYDWIALKGYSKQMKVGTYTGNGGTQSIAGAGFSPDYVIAFGTGARAAIHRSASMTSSFRFDTPAAAANGLTSLDNDGFSVGNSAEANSNGIAYHYVAWNEIPGLIKEGSYAGNAADNRPITGATFQPEYVVVKSGASGAACNRAVQRGSSLTGDNTHYFANLGMQPDFIQALQPDGFQVGTNCRVNTNAQTYYWVAFKNKGCPLPKTIGTSADSWADQANTGTNYGGDPTLKVISRIGQSGRAFVQFPLPSLPPGCSVTNAQLRLYDNVPSAGRILTAARVNAAWTEGGVNWTNQPAVTGGTTNATAPAAAGWMQWDVTAQIQAMYSGTNYGLRIVDSNEFSFTTREQQLNSREAGSNQPELVLTFG